MHAASVICSEISRSFDRVFSKRTLTTKTPVDIWEAGAANVHWVIVTDDKTKYSADTEKSEIPVYVPGEFSKLLARVRHVHELHSEVLGH